MALLTEDRKLNGIMGVLSVRDNITAAALPRYSPRGVLHVGEMRKDSEDQREKLRIKTPSLSQLIKNLSGGNQQKVVLSKCSTRTRTSSSLDEPTRGIDVGAKFEIYTLINKMVEEGKAVIVISSELEEILGVSDRIYTLAYGRITGEVKADDATQENLMELMTIEPAEEQK